MTAQPTTAPADSSPTDQTGTLTPLVDLYKNGYLYGIGVGSILLDRLRA